MSKIKTQVILIGTAVAVSSTATAYGMHKLHHKTQPTKITHDDKTEIKEYYQEITEINKNNTDLVVYESDTFDYKAVYTEGQILPLEVTYEANYSYSVTIDLSKATVYQIGNQIYISLNVSNVKLHKIEVSEPNLSAANTPISFMFKGKQLAELNAKALDKSTQSIQSIVNKDISAKKDIIQSNIYNKVSSLYTKIPNVVVRLEGEIK